MKYHSINRLTALSATDLFAIFLLSLSLSVSAQDSTAYGDAETSQTTEASSLPVADSVVAVDDTATHGALRRAADGVIYVAETVLDALTLDRDNWSLALYPAASYSGRSGFAIGIMPMLQLRSARLPRPATITPSILYSTKRMFEIQCDADVYLPHRLDLTAKFETYRQPDDLYAIGNGHGKKSIAQYDFMRRMFTFDALKGLGASGPWRIGLSVDADYYSFSKIEAADSSLVDEVVALTTNGGGDVYGAGPVVAYDSRDNVLSPAHGAYVRLKGVGYGRLWGHGSRFALLTIDARHYWSLPLKSVMAAQIYANVGWGDVPFTKMPTFGGTRLGRAIGHSLKYVDNGAWLAQAEWRVPLFWRIGATAFGAVGNVADKWGSAFDGAHLMCGAGLRLAVFPGKGLNLRLDAGLSNHGDRAIYFNIREAF